MPPVRARTSSALDRASRNTFPGQPGSHGPPLYAVGPSTAFTIRSNAPSRSGSSMACANSWMVRRCQAGNSARDRCHAADDHPWHGQVGERLGDGSQSLPEGPLQDRAGSFRRHPSPRRNLSHAARYASASRSRTGSVAPGGIGSSAQRSRTSSSVWEGRGGPSAARTCRSRRSAARQPSTRRRISSAVGEGTGPPYHGHRPAPAGRGIPGAGAGWPRAGTGVPLGKGGVAVPLVHGPPAHAARISINAVLNSSR